ncbi:MAG: redox-regulated ATPase YchF [Patescibacteria group bacterium]|nr:redox-regulated ATPase YchF [Patescibacteria group bacterium]
MTIIKLSLSIGIVGLPNVGKSTLFQTLTKKEVDRANYPFCTIDPNVGVVVVPDERVDKLANLTHSAKKIYTTIEFVDIAGLVAGAHKGEGLGNQFLAHIREVDAIIYILRAFKNENVANTQNIIDPIKEKEILDLELILKDLDTVNKIIQRADREAKTGSKEAVNKHIFFQKIKNLLEQGKILTEQSFAPEELPFIQEYQLLTLKPRLYLLNGEAKEVSLEILKKFKEKNWPYLIMNIKNEFEAGDLSAEERAALGLPKESEMDILIKKAYVLLNLITFLTTGEDETRAWTTVRGAQAPQAGGVIHSDFEKNFIRAEVINWRDLVSAGGFSEARAKGLIRTEGKEYVIQDGDVIEIKHGA